jgi:hypothetical protein
MSRPPQSPPTHERSLPAKTSFRSQVSLYRVGDDLTRQARDKRLKEKKETIEHNGRCVFPQVCTTTSGSVMARARW